MCAAQGWTKHYLYEMLNRGKGVWANRGGIKLAMHAAHVVPFASYFTETAQPLSTHSIKLRQFPLV